MEKNSIPTRPPLERPPFTIKQIMETIPPHCFQRSAIKSLGHLSLNLFICALLFYLGTYIDSTGACKYFLWPLYWVLQGVYMGGLWVLAHECVHGAFSDYVQLDDTVGFILHSFLLVPYHSWRITHQKHHLNAGNLEHDQVFVAPPRSSVDSKIVEKWEESPVYNGLTLFLMLTLGWMPSYLISNFAGPVKHAGNANHFNPYSSLFLPKQWKEIVMADVGVLTVFLMFVFVSMTFGFRSLFFFYGVPYIIVNCLLVLVTFLNHTDEYIPRYRDAEWTWLRGALATADRSFGPWLDSALHHISNTHVCHHLFPKMPFYHTVEATNGMRKILGEYYLRDETPIMQALWRAYSHCKFVEDEGDIVFYKKSLKIHSKRL